jgi:dTDP-glucose 4,6-dehydratase
LSNQSILVLGSNSFSGSSFASRLPQNWSKHLVFRTPLPSNLFSAKILMNEGDTLTQWNLNEDSEKILELVQREKITTVVNFAAQSMVGESWDRPEDWYEANVMSFSKLLNKFRKQEQLNKFIHFSTPEVYGSTTGPVKENFNFAPNTPYAISRAASDWHLKALHENFGFPVIFTRAANVYGEHQRLYRVIPRVIISALSGERFPLQGGGKSIRSFIHIDDVSDALITILKDGKIGDSYHISTNELITIYDLVSMIAEKLNVRINDLAKITPDRSGKDFAYQLDSKKIRSELGWMDKILLSSGIDRTIHWVEQNLDELKTHPLIYEHKR